MDTEWGMIFIGFHLIGLLVLFMAGISSGEPDRPILRHETEVAPKNNPDLKKAA